MKSCVIKLKRMKNKIKVVFSIFLFWTFFSFGQNITVNLIKVDSTWAKEAFEFPINFAQSINYKGVAEIRFPPKGWIHPEHPFFWSYTYVWSIDYREPFTANQLKKDLETYFDGLNEVRENHNLHQKASATITLIKKKKSTTFFEGKIDTYDHFATNKRIILNVKIESHFCNETKKTVLFFKFSPKEYTHEVWETLDKIELNDEICNF